MKMVRIESKIVLALVTAFVIISSEMKTVETIVVPAGFEKYVNGQYFLGFMYELVSEENSRALSALRMLPCLKTFIEKYLSLQSLQIPILVPENSTDFSDVSQVYLKLMQSLRSTYVYKGALNPFWDHIYLKSGIIIVDEPGELSRVSFELLDLCGRDCKFLAILMTVFQDEASFLEESKILVEALWYHRVANVVFLGLVGDEVLASRSLSYKSYERSSPSSPVLVAECDSTGTWGAAKSGTVAEVYSPLRMNRSLVAIAFRTSEPYISYARSDNSSERVVILDESESENFLRNVNVSAIDEDKGIRFGRLDGLEGLVMTALASYLDFVIIAEEISLEDNLASEVESILWIKDFDMVLGGLNWAPKNETDYTMPYEIVQIGWLLPIRPSLSLQGLVSPFENRVWFAIIGVFVFASIVELVLKQNVEFLKMLSLVIGVAWPNQPKKSSARLHFISYVIFGYLVTQFYLASLAGQLMASSEEQMDTLRDLLESNYEIGGPSSIYQLFNGTHEDNGEIDEDDIDLLAINEMMCSKFVLLTHEAYEKRLDDLLEARDTSLVLPIKRNISSMAPTFLGKRVHQLREVLASYPLSFAVWRGMPYLSDLDRKISDLIEGGIIDYWVGEVSRRQYGIFREQFEEQRSNVDLNALVPGFLLLLMGYALATLSFFAEIAIFVFRRNRARKIQLAKAKPTKSESRQKIKGKEIEPMDPRAWILNIERMEDFRKKYDKSTDLRIKSPFEFVH